MGGSWTTNIILIVVVVGIIVFAVVTTITGRKTRAKERAERKRTVKNRIKIYLWEKYKVKNARVEYEKVIARKGKQYKYRDIFDVLIDVYEPKRNVLLFSKAFEVEGISHKVNRKQFRTDWVVNQELDYAKTRYQIAVNEGKIELTKAEQAKRNAAAKAEAKADKKNRKNKTAASKRNNQHPSEVKKAPEKFAPRR